jgi:hypothetical protein
MKRHHRRFRWLPPWEMPADPIKAVFWFVHWSLRVLVRFCWLPLLAGVIYEAQLNGPVGGIITLLIGLLLWGGLLLLVRILDVMTSVAQTLTEVERLGREFASWRFPTGYQDRREEAEGRIVEGSIVDLEEKRRERQR